MMIIDSHLHIQTGLPGKEYYPPRYRWAMAMQWAYCQKPPYQRDPEEFFRKAEQRISDPDGAITKSAMDKAGVDAAVLITSDYSLGMGELAPLSVTEMHEHLGELKKRYRGRFYPFAGLDPRHPNAPVLLTRCFKEYELCGLKVMPWLGFYPYDRILYPLYKICLDWGKPVQICTNVEPGIHRPRFNEPVYVGDVIADFPDLNVILIHTGFPLDSWFIECLHMAAQMPNVYLEFDEWITYGSFLPALQLDQSRIVGMLAKARDTVGAHRILFGSDAWFGPSVPEEKALMGFGYCNYVNWWKNLPEIASKYGFTFTKDEVDLMMGGNMAHMLGVERKPEFERKHKYGFSMRTPEPRD